MYYLNNSMITCPRASVLTLSTMSDCSPNKSNRWISQVRHIMICVHISKSQLYMPTFKKSGTQAFSKTSTIFKGGQTMRLSPVYQHDRQNKSHLLFVLRKSCLWQHMTYDPTEFVTRWQSRLDTMSSLPYLAINMQGAGQNLGSIHELHTWAIICINRS